MRMVLGVAAFAFLAACDGTPENKAIGNIATPANQTAPVPENGSAPNPPPPAFLPSRVAGSPDPPSPYFPDRGGIARKLSGEEGGGAAANRAATINNLVGRWDFDCNTGAGTLVFQPGLRFTAPGGSGRFQIDEGTHEVVFTFEDGDTETWTIMGMRPGTLEMERRARGGGKFSRRLCSATP